MGLRILLLVLDVSEESEKYFNEPFNKIKLLMDYYHKQKIEFQQKLVSTMMNIAIISVNS